MEIIIILAPLALLLGLLFLASFIWSAKEGQYDDLETPGMRMLLDDEMENYQSYNKGKKS